MKVRPWHLENQHAALSCSPIVVGDDFGSCFPDIRERTGKFGMTCIHTARTEEDQIQDRCLRLGTAAALCVSVNAVPYLARFVPALEYRPKDVSIRLIVFKGGPFLKILTEES